MASTKGFFDKEDSPHGLSKRVVLYRYLQAKTAMALNTAEPSTGGYDFTYFDAFCGTGKYLPPSPKSEKAVEPEIQSSKVTMDESQAKSQNLTQHKNGGGIEKEVVMETDSTEKGTKNQPPFPVEYGSPLVALEALVKFFKTQYYKEGVVKRVLYIFEDMNIEYIDKLKENIRQYFKDSGIKDMKWIKEEQDHWTININHSHETKSKRMIDVNAEINIMFIKGKFEDLDPRIVEHEPMVTLLDPFGYSDTPMERLL